MPKVFISHSWEDNEISRKLAEYLKRDGAEIWIDYARISGGENLPDRIGEALEWCDTLVLIWSKSAANSYYVGLEWKNALDLKKKIIPCLIDATKRPIILRSFLYIDFNNFERGYQNLARALILKTQGETKEAAKIIPKKLKTLYSIILVISVLIISAILFFSYLSEHKQKESSLIEKNIPSRNKLVKYLKVEVLNGSGVDGISKEVTDYLRERDIDVVFYGNYESNNISETFITDYKDYKMSNAKMVAETLGVNFNRVFPNVDSLTGLDVSIVLGNDYSKLKTYHYEWTFTLDSSNVYSGPGESYVMLNRIGPFVKVKIIKEEGNWYLVEYEKGLTGYMKKECVFKI